MDLRGEVDELPAEFDLELFDPARDLAAESENGDTAPEQIVCTADRSGLWYARVYGYLGAYSALDPYLLVVTLGAAPTATSTVPARLISQDIHNLGLDVNPLLSDMAQLAAYKQGVLGYFRMRFNDKAAFKKSIRPGGEWAKALHPDFIKPLGGYLLIVGETEIIPAWTGTGFSNGMPVPLSDYPCADMSGENSKPQPNLVVGRIIGDSATALDKPIRASVGVHQGASGYAFGRDNALLISGAGMGEFVADVDDLAKNLESGGEFTTTTTRRPPTSCSTTIMSFTSAMPPHR